LEGAPSSGKFGGCLTLIPYILFLTRGFTVKKTAYLIADPKEYSNLFPDWSWALEVLVYIAAARYPPILHIRLNNAFELKGARGQSQQTCTRNFAKIPCEILSRC
jgi:hypothetical protein